jgi:ribonuclease P/MRP protein subunit RPP1
MYNDPSVTHAMARSPTIRMYNIIAALPLTDTALQHACQNFIGDIITYNTKTIRFRLNRKFYYLALRRNMFFELKYSPAIKDSNERRLTITRSHQCHLTGRSRGIILSSAAEDRFDLRSPCDVANLGLIFNLSEDQAKSAVNSMCTKVLIAAESRRLGKNPVLARYEDVDTTTSEEDDDDEEDDEPNSKKIKLS